MEFTNKDASAFARLCERKKARVCETRHLLQERSRQLMEQSALLKDDIDAFKSELATVGIQDYLIGVAHVCACAPLCPAVWSMLPVELLQCVFSCLSLLEIIRLRVLSKTWDKYVTGVTPGFTKLCAERSPNQFALVSKGSARDGVNLPVDVKLFDSKGERWHRFVHETELLAPFVTTMFAGDGGLVCLVSNTRDKTPKVFSMKIVVFNPLTRQGRQLPLCSYLSGIHLRNVQLVMDRDSKCYKVLVVGTKEQGGDAVARIFSSETREWSKPNIFSDLIFCGNGRGHGMVTGEKDGPFPYNCSSSTLLELNDGYPCLPGLECHGNLCRFVLVKDRLYPCKFVFVKDRLYVLHINDGMKCIVEEYQAQSCKPHWDRLKVHKGFEIGYEIYEGDHKKAQLWGCQNFLILHPYGRDTDDYFGYRTLCFDLSTCKW